MGWSAIILVSGVECDLCEIREAVRFCRWGWVRSVFDGGVGCDRFLGGDHFLGLSAIGFGFGSAIGFGLSAIVFVGGVECDHLWVGLSAIADLVGCVP